MFHRVLSSNIQTRIFTEKKIVGERNKLDADKDDKWYKSTVRDQILKRKGKIKRAVYEECDEELKIVAILVSHYGS